MDEVRKQPLYFGTFPLHSKRQHTSNTIGRLVRRHIVAGEFHYVGKEASTRWAGGLDLSMMTEAEVLDAADETLREYERIVDPRHLEQIRAETVVGIEIGRADRKVKGYHSRPFGCEVGSQFHQYHVSRSPPIL